MSDVKAEEIKQVPDSELTDSQLKKREKNRANRAKKRDKAKAKPKTELATQQPVQKQAEKRLSFEEKEEQRAQKKLAKIERNGRDSVVILAETTEAKSLAFKVDEINRVTSFTRSNMGTDRVSFTVGQKLLEMFNHKILGSIDEFIDLAAQNNIGSPWTLDEYKKEQKIIKNQIKKADEKREKYISNENAVEKKAREAKDKLLEKAASDVTIAQENLANSIKAFEKQTHEFNELSKTHADQFADSISKQNERLKDEREATQAAEKEKNTTVDESQKETETKTEK